MLLILAGNIGDNFLSLIIPGIVSIIIVILTNRNNHKDHTEAEKSDVYKAELESIHRQRESANLENEKLREALREELDDCRELRHGIEQALEELKIKVNTIEAELFAWRNGLKTPTGYILVRIPNDLNQNPQS